MTQDAIVLKHLQERGSITALSAVNDYGILRLSERIRELKAAGYEIDSTTETGLNRYGAKTRYTRYVYKGKRPCASDDTRPFK